MLDTLYELDVKKIGLIGRKTLLSPEISTLIFGPAGVGKTSLLFLLLSQVDKRHTLYIDYNDKRLDKNRLPQELSSFIRQKKISLLCIDNVTPDFPFPFGITVIGTSRTPFIHRNFETLWLEGADFEEYLAFKPESRHKDFEHIGTFASHYFKEGTLPAYIGLQEPLLTLKRQEYIQHTFQQGSELFFLLSTGSGHILSSHHLYKRLKEKIAISKDSVYALKEQFVHERTLYLLPRWNDPSHKHTKHYIYDFSLISTSTLNYEFFKIFENAIYLAVRRRYLELFWTPACDFYIPQTLTGILCFPFGEGDKMYERFNLIKSHLQELGIKRLEMITLGYTKSIKIDKISIEAIPFWEWSLRE